MLHQSRQKRNRLAHQVRSINLYNLLLKRSMWGMKLWCVYEDGMKNLIMRLQDVEKADWLQHSICKNKHLTVFSPCHSNSNSFGNLSRHTKWMHLDAYVYNGNIIATWMMFRDYVYLTDWMKHCINVPHWSRREEAKVDGDQTKCRSQTPEAVVWVQTLVCVWFKQQGEGKEKFIFSLVKCSGKQIKYLVSEYFTDMFYFGILVTCQVC